MADHDSHIYLLNHIFRPRTRPSASDRHTHAPQIILDVFLSALSSFHAALFTSEATARHTGVWDCARQAFMLLDRIHGLACVATIEKSVLEHEFLGILAAESGGGSDQPAFVPLYVELQNAGILVERLHPHLLFHTFELETENHTIYRSTGRLHRRYPDTCVRVESRHFVHNNAITPLSRAYSTFLQIMSTQALNNVQFTTSKHGDHVPENKEAVSSVIIGKSLVSSLLAHGESYPVTTITKRSQNEIFYSDEAPPWRRSPFLLFLKVTLRLILQRLRGDDSLEEYKLFMLHLAMHAVPMANLHTMSSENLHMIMCGINRKLEKLERRGTVILAPLRTQITQILDACHALLQSRAKLVVAANIQTIDTEAILEASSNFKVEFEFPLLDSFIETLHHSSRPTSSTGVVHGLTIKSDFCDPKDGILAGVARDQSSMRILNFENWLFSGGPKVTNNTSGETQFLDVGLRQLAESLL